MEDGKFKIKLPSIIHLEFRSGSSVTLAITMGLAEVFNKDYYDRLN